MRIFLALILHSAFCILHSYAKGRGTTAANFLRIGVSGRQAAMGDAAIGLSDDAAAALTSPAAWGRLYRNEASLLRTEWLDGINYTGAVYGHSSRRAGNWGASLLWLDIPDMEGYDVRGGAAGNVEAGDRAFLLGHGRSFGDLAAGANVKFVQQNLDGITASAWALDAGLHWRLPWETPSQRFDLGAAVRNMGTKVKFIEEAGSLPLSADIGLGYHALNDALRAGLDLSLPAEGGLEPRLGVEYWVANVLAVRAGYKPEQDLGTGLSFGIGLRVRQVHFDYAVANFGDLDSAHRLSLRFRFGGTAAADYDEALRDAQEGRTLDALRKLDRVLEQEPHNAEALLQMRTLKQLHGAAAREAESPYQRAGRLFEEGQYLAAMDETIEALIRNPERGEEIRRLAMSIGMRMQVQEPRMTARERADLRRLLRESQAPEGTKSPDFLAKEYRQARDFYKEGYYLRAYHLFQDLQAHGSPSLQARAGAFIGKIRRLMTRRSVRSDAGGYYARAFLAYLAKDNARAASNWEKVLQLEPHNEEAALYLNLVQEETEGSRLRARLDALIQDGLAEYREGRYESAYRAWQEALALSPGNPEVATHLLSVYGKLFEEAKRYYREGQFERTIQLLEEIEKHKPLSETSQVLLEDSREQLERQRRPAVRPAPVSKPEAPAAPEEAPAVDKEKAVALYQEGFAAYARRDLDKAIELWERAVKFDPENRRYREALERARLDKKMLSE